MLYPDDHARKRVITATNRAPSGHQADMSLCGYYRSQLGSSRSENETTERPGYKVHSGRSRDRTAPRYKSFWAQWKSIVVRNCILERHWESANGRSKIVQIVLPRSRVNDLLTDLHGGPSGHKGVNKTLNKVWQRYYWL
jgi:hypothetical protein